jgi:hypothetical protein
MSGQPSSDLITIITTIITTSIGIIGGLFGIITYRKNQTLKRQEIILPLMKEFDDNKNLHYAKELIDGVPIELEFDKGKSIKYKKDDLPSLLRQDAINRELTRDEITIRNIFDALLNFFGRLGYLIDIGVITKKE